MKNLIMQGDNILISIKTKYIHIELPDNQRTALGEENMPEEIKVIAVGKNVDTIKTGDEIFVPIAILNRANDISEEIDANENKDIRYTIIKEFDVQAIIK